MRGEKKEKRGGRREEGEGYVCRSVFVVHRVQIKIMMIIMMKIVIVVMMMMLITMMVTMIK